MGHEKNIRMKKNLKNMGKKTYSCIMHITLFFNNTQDFFPFAFALQKANLRVKMVQEKNITKKQKQSKTKLENME